MTGADSKDRQVLLKADAATIAFKAEKTGHIRANASSLRDPAVVLPGEQLVIRWERGQVVVVRQEGPPAPPSDGESLNEAGY